MPEFVPVLKRDAIQSSVAALGRTLSADYQGRSPILIGVLKGAFVFLADLIRHLTLPVQIDFVRTASYGDDMTSSGSVRLTKDVETDLTGKDVLIVEDIVDSGLTISYLIDLFTSRKANSVRVCALIDKRERRETAVCVDYACHVVESGYLVGYGLDYAEEYRQLPDIYHLSP